MHVDNLDELVTLSRWVNLLSSSDHNRGEATVLARAQAHGAVAVVDDRAARLAAGPEDVEVHDVLWVVAHAVRGNHVTARTAASFVEVMARTGARYPPEAVADFETWAGRAGLL